MKKGLLTMMVLLLGMSGLMAQKTLVVAGAGDVTIKQGDTLEIKGDGSPITFTKDGIIKLTSYRDYDVTFPDLRNLKVTGAGDVESIGKLEVPYLDIVISGTGDANLSVECDTIVATLTGIGDLILNGHCRYLEANVTGLGDLDFHNFTADSLAISKTRKGEVYVTRPEGQVVHKNLLFNPYWNGVEAGLNMLLGNGPGATFPDEYAMLDQHAMKSWNFNFNIADIGLAFSLTHRAGVYTGIGLGWHNYSFSSPVELEKGENKLICNAIDEAVEGHVKKSKLGILYLQAPLMFEVRPTNKFFVAAGVTAGLRIHSWTTVKFQDGKSIKTPGDYYLNRFKLDASLRVGTPDVAFFAHYNLIPVFQVRKAPTAHSLSFGFALNF